MGFIHKDDSTGTLTLVSTPIGNLGDITVRALAVLKGVDTVLAEDTRRSGRLLSHYGVRAKLSSYHDHNKERVTPGIIERLKAGEDFALVSDAGTPGISDPGAVLVRMAVEAGIEVIPIPGPSAVVTLLSVSGLPTDRFVFEGFLPLKGGKKKRRLEGLVEEERTMIFYESPHRTQKTLALMLEVFGDRRAALGREMTKVFEEVARGRLSDLCARFDGAKVRGEVTLAVAGSGEDRRGDSLPQREA